MLLLFATVLLTRTPLRLDVIRDRGQLYQQIDGGLIENAFTLKIIKMDRLEHRYTLNVLGLPSARLLPDAPIAVAAGEMLEAVVRVQVNPDELADFNTAFQFELQTIADAERSTLSVRTDSRFLGPRPLTR